MVLYYVLLIILIVFDIYTFNKNKASYNKKEVITYIFLTLIAITLSVMYFKNGSFQIAEKLVRYLN